ncbi:MucBP domain-containing protein, partial [Dellaglioa carnosa]|uniref:MucBP domain-containing protein n=1 Tax=Dellaglioa carnosa TaxID=2995136 RepID=UPI0022A8B06F
TGTVTAKYVDETGKTLSPDIVISGAVGAKYKTAEQTFNGYKFKEIKQGSAATEGTYVDGKLTVVYVYIQKSKSSITPPVKVNKNQGVTPSMKTKDGNPEVVNNSKTVNANKKLPQTGDKSENKGTVAFGIFLSLTSGFIYYKSRKKY